jgi:hypothetical protein
MSTPGNNPGSSRPPGDDIPAGSSRQVPEEEAGVHNDYLSQQYLAYHCGPDPEADDEMEEDEVDGDDDDERLASSDDEEQMKKRLALANRTADDHDYDAETSEDGTETASGNETASAGGNETASAGGVKKKKAKAKAKEKAPRKERALIKVGTKREVVNEVDPASGEPTLPEDLASSYPGQIGAILRETANINDTNIRHKLKTALSALLIAKLHARYEFPPPYDNQNLHTNIVNTQALIKFSKALSSWKTRLRNKVDKKMPWEQIQKYFPTVSLEDFKKFLENEDDGKMKDLRAWGREMRDKNLGNHRLGSRGYRGAKKKWKKQDEALRAAGKTNPYDKYEDPKAQAYIRSRYYFNKKGELVTDSQRVRDLEAALLVRNLITSLL